MRFDWILSPITQYAALGAGLIGAVSLWAMAQVELRGCQKKLEELGETTDSRIQALTDDLNTLRSASVAAAADPVPATTLTQSLNLTRRTQVLRMHRRGEQLNSIAGALGIPSGEVELLLKLDKYLEEQPR